MLGTIRPVPAHLPPRGPALAARRLVTSAALAVALGACGAEPGGTVAAGEEPVSTTTAPERTVPAATDGSLRAHVPAAEPAEPVEPTEAAIGEVLLYGDSVALLLADDLAAALSEPLTVDAVDCRRLDAGFEGPCGGVPAGTTVASGLEDLERAAGELEQPSAAAAVVVIANNAALRAEQLDAAMATLTGVPRVWWVTARVGGRGWQDPNNQLLDELAARDERARIIDWFAASAGQDWLADNVHPDDQGQAALAELVAAHLECDCTP